MKCTTVIDPNREEEVLIYAHEKTALIQEIEELVEGKSTELLGYRDNVIHILSPADVFCFLVEDNRVYALTEKEKYRMKQRLYHVETALGRDFVKINQSCIVNVRKIQKFDASLAGALMVTLKNGYRDYVSRRQLKAVKERIGFRL